MTDFDAEQPVPPEPPQVADDVPEADALEQQSDLDAADVPEEPVDPQLEADPADVEEQQRVVPLDDDDRAADG
jgi:hypothetical protein